MAGDEDTYKIQRFHGRQSDDYTTWRLRAEIALKGKGYWEQIQSRDCKPDVKNKAAALLANALGDHPFRVCSSALDNPMEMLNLLDARYASTRAASRVSILTTLYTKKYTGKYNMEKYVDEFEVLFNQLERMGKENAVPENHKAVLLMASMGHDSPLENTLAALRIQDNDSLTWEAVTADLIQEYKKKFANQGGRRARPHSSRNESDLSSGRPGFHANQARKPPKCSLCQRKGHIIDDCFLNPESPRCKLPEHVKKKFQANSGEKEKPERKTKKKLHFSSYGLLINRKDKVTEDKVTEDKVAEEKFPSFVPVYRWEPKPAEKRKNFANTANSSSKPLNQPLILDSGASTTFFKSSKDVKKGTYKKEPSGSLTLAAGSTHTECTGTGTLRIGSISLPGSVEVSNLNNILVSVGHICDQKKIVVFTKNEAVIINSTKFEVEEDDVVAIAPRNHGSGLYEFPSNLDHKAMNGASATRDINLWHKRLVHVNQDVLHALHESCSDIPKIKGRAKKCHPCKLGKARKKSFRSHFKPTTFPGEVVHSDLAGPIPKSLDGRQYFITFVDQHTRFTHVMGLTAKCEAQEAFDFYQEAPLVNKHFPKGVERIHADGGGEYASFKAKEMSTTCPDTPQHNPFAERVNRSFLDPVRVLLEESGLSAKYWEYALDHVAYVKNRLPHSALQCSPFEALTGNKPKLKHVRVFGCAAFVYNESPKSKVHARAIPGIFLGCDDNGVYLVESLVDRKLVNSVHVTFDEASFPGLENRESSSSGESDDMYETESSSSSEAFPSFLSDDDEPSRYPARNRKPPSRFGQSAHADSLVGISITTSDDPSVKEAMSSSAPEKKEWEKAIQEELDSLEEKGTWQVVSKSAAKGKSGGKILPTHVVLRIKRDSDGNPSRFKARIVAGGNLQTIGRDVDSVYAPVVDYTVTLLTLALSHQMNWVASHVDVKAAFLNGEIDRETYVFHPHNLPPHMRKANFYKLNKALYGLRQAPLRWFLKLRDTLTNVLKYKQLQSDGSVFIKKSSDSTGEAMTVVLCYVDDLIFFSSSKCSLKKATSEFLQEFEGSEDNLHWYLGVRIDAVTDKLYLSQSSYIKQCLEEFRIQDVNIRKTPAQINLYDELSNHKNDPVIDKTEYRKLIGTLQFIALRTRPDIATAVGILSQYSSKPTNFLLRCAKNVFAYLKGTLDHCLEFSRNQKESLNLEFYCDSDYAGDKMDRKSRTGFIGYLNGCPFVWGSKKQTCVAASTAEAEYIAMGACAKEIARVRLYLAELELLSNTPTPLYSDNNPARCWSQELQSMRKAKHIEIRYHLIRHKFHEGSILPLDIKSEENPADGFTKPLNKIKFNRFLKSIAVTSGPEGLSRQGEC